jgi:hypothetical protein
MTVDEIRAKVAGIAANARDNEQAHSHEDHLHQSVLAAIRDGAPNPAELAAEALKTQELSFARWCA